MKDPGYHDALALLDWQVELGADEAILDAPVNRFDLHAPAPAPEPAPVSALALAPTQSRSTVQAGPAAPIPASLPSPDAAPMAAAALVDAAAIARKLAEGAGSLDALRDAMAGFEHCDLKRGARNFVFCDGHAGARVMVVGEAPGRDEDLRGKPFVGRAGQLLDRMFAAIGLDRAVEGPDGLYITNMLPWRPPQNRDPKPDELAMMVPFLRRHVELADPQVLVLMGNHACAGLLGRRGITRLRGNWHDVQGRPAMPMLHPAYLLRNPSAKREAWADLLDIRARLG